MEYVSCWAYRFSSCINRASGAPNRVIDDYKYSVDRIVLYKHPNPGRSAREYGRYGPDRTLGVVRAVELDPSGQTWLYSIDNIRTDEHANVHEAQVYYTVFGRRLDQSVQTPEQTEAARLAEEITRVLSQPELRPPLSPVIRDLVNREQTDEEMRRHGRELPIQAGDYIRVRGDMRPEAQPYHNHYAKVLSVLDPDIGAIESIAGTYTVRKKYHVLLDDRVEFDIYDPEVKLYYTAEGRVTIFNWRAASFLAEFFGDDPPYRADYRYLESHLFTRDELEAMSVEELATLFAESLYVKGRMGVRDLQETQQNLTGAPKEHLVDGILAISRFDMRKNRNLTPSEIESRQKDASKLRRILKDLL